MLKLLIFNEAQQILFKGKTTKLQLPEELIVSKSVEWFGDPNPCFIHRSAVMKRLFIELEDEMITYGEQQICREDITEHAVHMLSKYNGFKMIEYRR